MVLNYILPLGNTVLILYVAVAKTGHALKQLCMVCQVSLFNSVHAG